MGLLKDNPEFGERRYTYGDYAKWDLKEGERYELVDGVPYAMAAPSRNHQAMLRELVYLLHGALKGKSCEVIPAPFDVCLFGMGKQDKDLFQPDIFVVCDPKKLEDGKCCNGAPEFVIEITSPSNSGHDWFLKLNKYLQAGVREYWIVSPEEKKVYAHVLDDGKYVGKEYGKTDSVTVSVLGDCNCTVDLNDVFGVLSESEGE